jgi:uncharacterized membrane protein YcaP (DUF421 family)
MDAVLRGASVYLILLVIFRISGRRDLSKITIFDFVLLLIIAETTQQALLGEDWSITNSVLLIITLLGINLGLALWKQRSRILGQLIDGLPVILVDDGNLLYDRMRKSQVDESDILTAARESRGLERMEQIKYAVLERSGGISIIPK